MAHAQVTENGLYLNNEIKFERLGLEQGMNNFVSTLLQDRKGYMWFATFEDGLYKYDGHTLTHYQRNPRDTNSLADNSVTALHEDKNGLLWIGFGAGGGVNTFNPQTGVWKRYAHDPENPASLTSGPIHTIQSDHQGRLWFGSLNGGLCRFDPKTGQFTSFKNNPDNPRSISSNRVPSLLVDKAGQLWVGTSSGLDLFDSKTETFLHVRGADSTITVAGSKEAKRNTFLQHISGSITDKISLTQAEVHYIIQDDKGLLWLATLAKGVFVMDPVTKRFLAHLSHDPKLPNSLSHNYVVCLTQDKAGNYWMSTETGINRLDVQTGLFTVYQHQQYLPATWWSVHSVITDQGGVVWLGSTTKGALYFAPHPRKFHRFLHEAGSPLAFGNNEVHAIFKGSDSLIYLSTNYSLLRYHPETKELAVVYRSKKKKNEQAPAFFFTACEEKRGVFWIGTWGKGIIRYDANAKKESFFQHNKDSGSLAHNAVYALLRDRQGVIWVGTEGGHLQWYDAAQKKFHHYSYRTKEQHTQFDEESFRFLYEDKEGNLWASVKAGFAGTGGGGLYRINREKGVVQYYGQKGPAGKSLSSDAVTRLYEDRSGTLWLGTNGGGLNRLDPKTGNITVYTKENGLQSNKIEGLTGDKDDNLWISTNKGITFFNTRTFKTDLFDIADGLGGTPAGYIELGTYAEYATFKDNNGTIYFGSNNGMTVFHPEQIYVNQAKPPIALNQFKVFDKAIAFNENGIVLNHEQNFFDFEFTALNYLSSAKNQYAYLLEGVDKDWVYCGTRRIARYTDVQPGDYIFRVKGANNDGVWNEQGFVIPVTILPPWWRTWWAYVLYAVLFIGSLWTFIHYRSRNLLKQKKELEKQVTARTAEVVHQKEELQVTLENLKATQVQLVQKEKMASLGELTAGIAHEIQNPLNFVNNFSDVSSELLREAKEEMQAGNLQSAIEVVQDAQSNLQKIAHHGRRADSIVKSMLEHSRTAKGEQQATDINALAEEYIKLAYYGFRAKDSSFSVIMETHFDAAIGKVYVSPQEIGRVLLNLLNNAFYSIQQKKKGLSGSFEPIVQVSTRKMDNRIELSVEDNGIGIPEKIREKIFQPFFTTKPTGEGTGLGLSLSYDIITKGHGGELSVKSTEGEYAEFVVNLPIQSQ